MTPEEFVGGFYQERQQLFDTYFNGDGSAEVATLIADLKLDERGAEQLRKSFLRRYEMLIIVFC